MCGVVESCKRKTLKGRPFNMLTIVWYMHSGRNIGFITCPILEQVTRNCSFHGWYECKCMKRNKTVRWMVSMDYASGLYGRRHEEISSLIFQNITREISTERSNTLTLNQIQISKYDTCSLTFFLSFFSNLFATSTVYKKIFCRCFYF